MIVQHRGFALASVLTLTIGIVLNTAVFSIANALFFRPLPFRTGGELVHIGGVDVKEGLTGGLSRRELAEVAERVDLFEDAAAFQEKYFNVNLQGSAFRAWGGLMSHNACSLLGIAPVAGRCFTREEEDSGAPVVLIGELFWRTQLRGDVRALGKEIRVDGKRVTIVGILPREFRFVYTDYQVIAPVPVDHPPDERSFAVLARLRPDVSVQAASQSVGSAGMDGSDRIKSATPYRQLFLNARRDVSVLLVAAGLVLLIVCANVSNLFLAKVASRQRDIAIRLSLGAARTRIFVRLVLEGLLVGVVSGLLSAVVSFWLGKVILASVPQLWMFEVDFAVLAYTLLLSVVSGVVFGFAPAIVLCNTDPNEVLKASAPSVSGDSGRSLRHMLVISEIAVGLMLLAATGLLVKSMVMRRCVSVGFNTDHLVIADLFLEGNRYSTPEQRLRFSRSLVEHVSATPGVEADVADFTPLASGAASELVAVDGGAAVLARIASRSAGPTLLEVLRIRLLAGRSFTPADRQVAIVNDAFVRRFWPAVVSAADVIGRRIRIGNDPEWLTVVGVIPAVTQSLGEPTQPEVLRSTSETAGKRLTVIMRTTLPHAVLAEALRRAVQAIDPELPLHGPVSIDDVMENFLPMPVLYGVAIFAGAALLLGTIGLYGVMSHVVVQRTREIGVRIALGATRAEVIRIVLGHSVRLAAIGAALGLAGSLALSRLLAHYLEGVNTTDPVIVFAVTATLMIVAVTASAAPAVRACRVDPVVALRQQ